MSIRSLEALLATTELRGRRVFVRADLNVPLERAARSATIAASAASLPTLRKLLAAGARIVLASHLGRPKDAPGSQALPRPGRHERWARPSGSRSRSRPIASVRRSRPRSSA